MTVSENPFEGVPTQILDLAGSLTDFVERAVGIRPDFTPETLSIVDHYASLARAQMATRPEVSDLTAQGLGAYFGEVVRRSEGAFWQLPTANFHDWSLCGVSAFVAINPIGVGYDTLFASPEHNGPSSQVKLAPEDKTMVGERLGRLPEVRDNDYFTLCTRFEVFQIVMEAVRAAAETRGYVDMAYTAEDYGGALRSL